jgi:hypothetical protein
MKKKTAPDSRRLADIRGSDVTPPAPTTQAPRRTPKKHRARVSLRTGVEGWTENDILLPRPVKLGEKITAFDAVEINNWLAERRGKVA